jgi:hypothetical protein
MTGREGAPLRSGSYAPYILKPMKLGVERNALPQLDPSAPVRIRNLPAFVVEDALDMGDALYRTATWMSVQERLEVQRAPLHLRDAWRTHLRMIISIPLYLQPTNEEVWTLVDALLDRHVPNAAVAAAIHRDRAHVHVHVHILARQRDGRKLDLTGPAYTSLDESWSELYSRWSGYDPDIHLSKKQETRTFKRAVARIQAEDARQGRSRPLEEVYEEAGGRPERHDAYRHVPLRGLRVLDRAATELEQIHARLHVLSTNVSHDERATLEPRAEQLRTTLYTRLRRFVAASPEQRVQIERLVGPSELARVRQVLGPEAALDPAVRALLGQIRGVPDDPLRVRRAELTRILGNGTRHPESVWQAMQLLELAYRPGRPSPWERLAALAKRHGIADAVQQVMADPSKLGALTPLGARHRSIEAQTRIWAGRVRDNRALLERALRDQERVRTLQAELQEPTAARPALPVGIRVQALTRRQRADLMAYTLTRLPELADPVRKLLRGAERGRSPVRERVHEGRGR